MSFTVVTDAVIVWVISPELGPFVGPAGQGEGPNLQLLKVHSQDVGGGEGGSPPPLISTHQTQVVTLQKDLWGGLDMYTFSCHIPSQ